MKLAEALIERADLQRKLAQLAQRLKQNAQYQEGEEPAEQPKDLLIEYRQTIEKLEKLVVAVNQTNSRVSLSDGTGMTTALVRRDLLKAEYTALTALADAATPEQSRYSRSEIKMLAAVDIKAIRRQADEVAKKYRELDALVQQANWQYDVPL
ncbi:DIP1984 family protein [Neisseria montereyensis]|uniref:DIP1984 family protein n=1 Tax=Neisseria montereyensis TaxID=2973938 RepID=A0ABT2FHP8_9NEIS|nr:DIP1984 family protein [Neisseria montereyensis]MCS4534738.1 DIP1984 family protein [Neisseria montereyensis]